MQKIKIAHIITRMDWGGSADLVRLIYNGLDKDKYEIKFIYGKTDFATIKTKEFLKQNKDNCIFIPSLRRNINLFYDFIALCSLYKTFKNEKFDIVHTHTAKAGCLGRIAAKLNKVKVVVHTSHGHNFYGYFNPLMSKFIVLVERFLSLFTNKVITLTALAKKDLLEYKIIDEEKIIVAHTAVEKQRVKIPDDEKILALKKELRLQKDNIIVGMVGRLEHIKGVRYFIEAALWILEKFDHVKFVLVGEGSLKKELLEKINEKELSKHFVFCGWRDDAIDIMGVMDVLVLASLNEAVGLVLLEAQSIGVPVIATKVGGIPEVVDDGNSGILVEPKDVKQLFNALAILIEDDSKRKEMAVKAREFVQNKYDIDDLCFILMKTYESLFKR